MSLFKCRKCEIIWIQRNNSLCSKCCPHIINNNMPLFKCRKCGTVENTALTACSWSQMENPLCSECCTGKCHGAFPKTTEFAEGESDCFDKSSDDTVT